MGVVSTKAEEMERAARLVPPALAVQLAQALVAHLLAADSAVAGETLLLSSKVRHAGLHGIIFSQLTAINTSKFSYVY